jgi:hypothetical protein
VRVGDTTWSGWYESGVGLMLTRLGRSHRPRAWVFLTAAMLAILVLILDAVTPRGIAVGMLYPVVVLLSLWSTHRGDSFVLAAACMILTVAGYLFAPHDVSHWGIINRGLSMVAILGTAVLAYHRKHNDEVLQRSLSTLEQLLIRVLKGKKSIPSEKHEGAQTYHRERGRWARLWKR